MRISTTAYLKGSREAIIQMLTRVFRGLKSEGVTVGDDDTVEAINRTIQQANTILEGYHAEFTLPDFLDVQNRMNCPYEAYVLSYIDEPEPDGSANYGVDLIDVQEKDSGYSLRVASCRDEKQHGYLREDWQDWCERMVRLYGCRITTTEERYTDAPDDGTPVQYSCFYELDPLGVVNQTVIDLHNDLSRYWYLMDRLSAETGMTRDKQMRLAISDFESLAETLREEIERMKKALEKGNDAKGDV
ncbi:MAG: hypothetical protein IJK29_02565 [Bacteroidales bacterium]|nr:hypothetical protein [Bacteroidales bacterium]